MKLSPTKPRKWVVPTGFVTEASIDSGKARAAILEVELEEEEEEEEEEEGWGWSIFCEMCQRFIKRPDGEPRTEETDDNDNDDDNGDDDDDDDVDDGEVEDASDKLYFSFCTIILLTSADIKFIKFANMSLDTASSSEISWVL